MRSKVADIASAVAVAVAIVGVAFGTTLARAGKQDMVDTAVASGQFKTLAAALNAAGLVNTLKGPGPFTAFAPTDDAFAKLPPGTLDDLLKPENKGKLTAILTYHVVPGAVTSQQVTSLKEAKTVNGSILKLSARDGKVMINNADVVKPDIETSNGIHSEPLENAIFVPTPKVSNRVSSNRSLRCRETDF